MLDEDGVHALAYHSTDAAGNREADQRGRDFGADWDVGAEDTESRLPAERDGAGARTYTLSYVVSDVAGNTAPRAATVVVPHDHGEAR